MEKLKFQTEVFEGPLDLLLSLISKHKLDIFNIQIASLLEQYLCHIEVMRREDMEIKSEFLEMASRLVYIKTVSLLPKHGDEAEELSRELSGRLLEYALIKQAAAELSGRYAGSDVFVRIPEKIEADRSYTRLHDKELLPAFLELSAGKLRRKLPPPAEAFSGIVKRRVVSVLSKTIFVLRSLMRTKKTTFTELYEKSADRSELVAVFLAVLELIKTRRIRVSGSTIVLNAAPDRVKH